MSYYPGYGAPAPPKPPPPPPLTAPGLASNQIYPQNSFPYAQPQPAYQYSEYSTAYNPYQYAQKPAATPLSAVDAAIQRIRNESATLPVSYLAVAQSRPPVTQVQAPVVHKPAAQQTSAMLASVNEKSSANDPKSFPPALVAYCDRVFTSCSAITKPPTQAYLQEMIKASVSHDFLWKIDWSKQTMPRSVYDPTVVFSTTELNNYLRAAGILPTYTTTPNTALTKRLNPYDSDEVVEEVTLTKAQKRKAKAAKKAAESGGKIEIEADTKKFDQRSQRFQIVEKAKPTVQYVSLQKAQAVRQAADGQLELDWSNLKIVGTCRELEKKYFRLTSAPDPTTVRPEDVLKKAFEKLSKTWKENRNTANHNYLHLWEQFKALRQDLMVQSIRNLFTVQVYETHARICLAEHDLSEYNQCQTQLIQLYDTEDKSYRKNYTEFTTYRFLYYLVTRDMGEANSILKECRKFGLLDHEHIKFALNVWTAYNSLDFVRFFSAFEKSPLPLAITLVDSLFSKFRYKSLSCICDSIKPSIEADTVIEWLGFDDDEEGCRFLLNSGCVIVDDDMIDTKTSKIKEFVEVKTDDAHVTHGTFDSKKKV